MDSWGVVEQRLEDKLDRVFDEIKELGKVTAVQEQKLREINHRMGDGQQRNVFSHDSMRAEMNKRLDTIDETLALKVDMHDYKQAFAEMRDTLAKDRKMIILIVLLLVAGTNIETAQKLLASLFGMH